MESIRLWQAVCQKPQVQNHGLDGNTIYSKTVKPLAKHIPFVMPHVLKMESAYHQVIYSLLDVMNDHGKQTLWLSLDSGSRLLLKKWIKEWQQWHKYQGK
jgi:hypothetical protein